MQNVSEVKAAPAASQTCAGSARFNRRALYIAVALAGAAALFLGWEWLVAIGASALIISLLPCLIMCAFGICAARMCQKAPAKPGSGGLEATGANADAAIAKSALATDLPSRKN